MIDQKDTVLLQFLNSLYLEIRDMEEACGIRLPQPWLCPPIERHHEAVRVWSAGEDTGRRGRLSVARLSEDIRLLRQWAEWFDAGPHALWEDHHKKELEAKHVAIRNSRAIRIPMQVVEEDLSEFADRYIYGSNAAGLDYELRYRAAQKYSVDKNGHGRWTRVGLRSFVNRLRLLRVGIVGRVSGC